MSNYARLLVLLCVVSTSCTNEQASPSYANAKSFALQSGLSQSSTPSACPACVFGPHTFYRSAQAPVTEHFAIVGDPEADYLIDIDDDRSKGADGSVVLNGVVLLAPRGTDDAQPRHVRRAVILVAHNTLDVQLTGKPGSRLNVQIIGGAKTVGTNGGTVTSPGGLVRLVIPQGALTTETPIEISPSPLFPNPAISPNPLTTYELRPEGLIFSKPVSVALSYVPFLGQLPGPNSFGVVHWAGDGSFASPLTAVDDLATSTVTMDILHFSLLTGEILPSGSPGWRVFYGKWILPQIKWYLRPLPSGSQLTHTLVQQAFAKWEAVTANLAFQETFTEGSAQLIVEDVGIITVVPPITGGGAIGTSCQYIVEDLSASPLYGQTCLDFFTYHFKPDWDTDEQFTIQVASTTVEQDGGGTVQALNNLVHEIGHAIGIAHPSRYPGDGTFAIMHQGLDYSLTLHPWDVSAAQYHYGAPTPPPSQPTGHIVSSNFVQVFIADPDGQNQRPISPDFSGGGRLLYYPSISRDGSTVAYTVRTISSTTDLFVGPTDGSSPPIKLRTGCEFCIATPAWSPDGSRLVYSRSFSLYIMDRDGANEVPIGVSGSYPDWSADGQWIVFNSASYELSLVHPDGSGLRVLLPFTPAVTIPSRPKFSPDGARILFYNISASAQAFTLNVDGTGLTQVTNWQGPGGASYPVWSPDGNFIAFTASGGSSFDLVLQSLATGQTTTILSNSTGLHPTWGH